MNNILDISEFKNDFFEISLESDINNNVIISFSGRIYIQNLAENLEKYLCDLHNAILEKNIFNISVNFSGLHLLNSGGVKSIIRWFKLNDNTTKDKQYKINIIYSSKIEWQETSFGMMKELFPEIINVKSV